MSEPAVVIDCRGLPCPVPIIRLGKRYVEVGIGELVAVEADDVAAAVDVPAWCRMRGQEYVGAEPTPDGVPRYVVRRLS